MIMGRAKMIGELDVMPDCTNNDGLHGVIPGSDCVGSSITLVSRQVVALER